MLMEEKLNYIKTANRKVKNSSHQQLQQRIWDNLLRLFAIAGVTNLKNRFNLFILKTSVAQTNKNTVEKEINI